MSSSAPVKRYHRNRLAERRVRGGAGSSRDASEEDNDAISDVGSMISVPDRATPVTQPPSGLSANASPQINRSNLPPPLPLQAALGAAGMANHKRNKRDQNAEGSQSEGFDSPMYDGDVESSSTIGGTPAHATHPHASHHRRPSSPTPHSHSTPQPTISPYGQKIPTPKASRTQLVDDVDDIPLPALSIHSTTAQLAESNIIPADVPVAASKYLAQASKTHTQPLSAKSSNAALGPPKMYTRPKELPIEDIKAFVQRAIDGDGGVDGVERWWKTNPAPADKVVRVYADGVYDLFHFGHALQLRQAKLSFPKVYLLVGVCSDQLCASHKSPPSMTHAERCESVRHCRWVDEILPDAPWVVDQAWLDKHQIDYIAHDELVYPGAGHDDVYAFAKGQGRFVPTRRTPAISTSELLERIVRGYRDGFFDSKLSKNGHPELLAVDVDWDSSTEKREKREKREREARARGQQSESD